MRGGTCMRGEAPKDDGVGGEDGVGGRGGCGVWREVSENERGG